MHPPKAWCTASIYQKCGSPCAPAEGAVHLIKAELMVMTLAMSKVVSIADGSRYTSTLTQPHTLQCLVGQLTAVF